MRGGRGENVVGGGRQKSLLHAACVACVSRDQDVEGISSSFRETSHIFFKKNSIIKYEKRTHVVFAQKCEKEIF